MAEATRRGGCQCGRVRYVLQGGGRRIYACHCRACRKQSASAFGLTLPVRPEHLAITGETALYARPAHSGGTTRCVFCPACGTRLYHRDESSALASLKVGSLDDPSGRRLVAHLWVTRKLAWVLLDPDLPAFETQPEDLAAWRERLAGRAGETDRS